MLEVYNQLGVKVKIENCHLSFSGSFIYFIGKTEIQSI